MRAFLEFLLGLPCADGTKKTRPLGGRKAGIFGIPLAYCTCYETQARGSLHFHGLFWGGVPPHVLNALVKDAALQAALAAMFDRQMCASLPAELHAEWESRVRSGRLAPRMLEEKQKLGVMPAGTAAAMMQLTDFGKRVMAHLQMHKCYLPSCGKPPAGKIGCRFAKPSAAGDMNSHTKPQGCPVIGFCFLFQVLVH